MKYGAMAALLLLTPSLALAAGTTTPQALQLSAKAQVDGASVPLGVTVSTESTDVVLSPVDKDGATPVTVTLYIVPKPKPAATSSAAAAVETSAGIQQSIGSISPAVEGYAAPVFGTLDSARTSAAGVLDSQLASTKARLAPNQPGQVLGAEAVKNSSQNPMGGFMYLLNTLYYYLLTLLRFIIGSVMVFYPLLAVGFLYFIWRGFRRFRRPAY